MILKYRYIGAFMNYLNIFEKDVMTETLVVEREAIG